MALGDAFTPIVLPDGVLEFTATTTFALQPVPSLAVVDTGINGSSSRRPVSGQIYPRGDR